MTAPAQPRASASRTAVLLGLALGLMQLAWAWSLPAFAGIDEFDHGYRAASVASGEWLPSGVEAPAGRGQLVTVPDELVDAASAECSVRDYAGPSNCRPAEETSTGDVTVASAAATYNPVFYWVTGVVAAPFQGRAALYVMRAVAALLCLTFVTAAAWALRSGARTAWPVLSMLVTVSPMVVYSSVVEAPNGLEIASALALWSVLIALARTDLSPTLERQLLIAAVPCAVTLATLRSMGPFWLALIMAVGTVVSGRARALDLLRRHRRLVAVGAAMIGASVVAGAGWTLSTGTNQPELHDDNGHPWLHAFLGTFVWLLQHIAAFPYRAQPAHPAVYLCAGLVFAALLVLGWRAASRRIKVGLLLAVLLTLAVPVLLTGLSYRTQGYIWQGRYDLPFSVGIALLCGHALDRAGRRLPPREWLATAGLALLAAHVVSTLGVLALEKRTSPTVGLDAWMAPSPWLVVGLFILAAVGVVSAVRLPVWHRLNRMCRSRSQRLADASARLGRC